VATAVPLSCTTPVLGSAQTTTMRLKNDAGYHTTFNPFNFITATTLAFSNLQVGRVVQGSTATHVMTISNPSTTVAATAFTRDSSLIVSPYSYVSTTCGATLAALASCTMTFTYAPTSLTVDHSADIDISYNDGVNTQTATINISGWGIELDTLMTSLDYGSIPNGNNHTAVAARFTKPVVIINRGKASVTLDSAAFSDSTNFRHTGGGALPGTGFTGYICGATLAAESKCVASVDFQPASTGAKSSTYTITYNTSRTKVVNLTGTGDVATPTTCNTALPYYDNGSGTAGDPWLICSEAHWTQAITDTQADTTRDTISPRRGKFQQTDDITFTSNITNKILATATAATFAYNGGGYRLVNVIIAQSGVSGVALFAATAHTSLSSIRNVQVYNASVAAGSNSGIITGEFDIPISNSYAFGVISGGAGVGGLQGLANGYGISNSYFIGEVTCTGQYCGGISGGAGTHTNNFAMGKVTNSGTDTGGLAGRLLTTMANSASAMEVIGTSNTGGLIGNNGSSVANITNSTSYAKVSGTTCVGGIIGYSYNSIGGGHVLSKSMFLGSVTGSGTYVAGIVGHIYRETPFNIDEVVSSGVVTGNNYVAGIFGGTGHQLNVVTINNSFTTSMMNSSGALTGGFSNLEILANSQQSAVRSYVAAPDGISSLFNVSVTATANTLVIGQSFDSFSGGVFYLQGAGPIQTAPVGVFDLTDAQMQSQAVFETSLGTWDFTPVTGKWKMGAGGYKYPILQWLPNNWMP